MWVYREFERGIFTVGHYVPQPRKIDEVSFYAESVFDNRKAAREQVNYLNGGEGHIHGV